MNRITRHTLLVLLCAIAALPMCLSAFFLGGRILIRKAMLEKLESAETVVLHLPADGLHWYKKDRELLIDGRMFDVKAIRPINRGYEVTGLFDDDETELFDQLVKTETGKQEGRGQLAGLFHSCLGIIAESPAALSITKPFDPNVCRHFGAAPSSMLWDTTLDQPGPPPKSFLS